MLATAAAILHDEPESLRSRRPDLPAGFAEIVHRCLAKEPARRPRSAAAVATALEHLQAGQSTRAVRRALGPRGVAWKGVAIALGALLLAAAAWGIVHLVGGRGERWAIVNPEAQRLLDQSEVYLARGTSPDKVSAAVELARRALALESGIAISNLEIICDLAFVI